MTTPFAKPWQSYASQVQTLQARGLVVPDPAAAAAFLSHVNYYRLSGYCLAFETARHVFALGTTFDHIRESYEFDFRLRDLLSEALEVVEVDVRTNVAHHFGAAYGAYGHTAAGNFHSPPPRPGRPPHGFDHARWLNDLRNEAARSKELFVAHFRRTYDGFPDLPVWVATEVMSFGCLGKMIQGMNAVDQRAVAARYGLQPNVLVSWVHHLCVVRNHCAHHSRVWDRLWSVAPLLPAGPGWHPPHLPDNRRLSATLLILHQMLKSCPAATPSAAIWRGRVDGLLIAPPASASAAQRMGLSQGWATGPLWR